MEPTEEDLQYTDKMNEREREEDFEDIHCQTKIENIEHYADNIIKEHLKCDDLNYEPSEKVCLASDISFLCKKIYELQQGIDYWQNAYYELAKRDEEFTSRLS